MGDSGGFARGAQTQPTVPASKRHKKSKADSVSPVAISRLLRLDHRRKKKISVRERKRLGLSRKDVLGHGHYGEES